MVDFESAFENFIEQNEYEEAEESIFKQAKEAVFKIARAAFNAGWIAAKSGEPILSEKIADGDN